jgi:hypothetical protein
VGRGNVKGSNGGGGRIKGQKNGETKEQALDRLAAEAAHKVAAQVTGDVSAPEEVVPVARPAAAGMKLGKDILAEAANYFFGMAAKYQPGGVEFDERKFERYLEKAADIANKLAPYQSQRLSATTITEVPMDLSVLTNEEIDQLERLHAKAAVPSGHQGGKASAVH